MAPKRARRDQAAPPPTASIADVPELPLFLILSHLSTADDLARAMAVCLRWRDLGQDDGLWRPLTEASWRGRIRGAGLGPPPAPSHPGQSWRAFFAETEGPHVVQRLTRARKGALESRQYLRQLLAHARTAQSSARAALAEAEAAAAVAAAAARATPGNAAATVAVASRTVGPDGAPTITHTLVPPAAAAAEAANALADRRAAVAIVGEHAASLAGIKSAVAQEVAAAMVGWHAGMQGPPATRPKHTPANPPDRLNFCNLPPSQAEAEAEAEATESDPDG